MGFVPALLLFVGAIVVTILSGVWMATFVARTRFRRATSGHVRATEQETPLTELSEADAGNLVFVRGRLLLREKEGRPTAVVSVGRLEPELVGPFTIMAADRIESKVGNQAQAAIETEDGDAILAQGRGERLFVLEHEDEVLVRARFARTVERSRGYRTAPTEHWWLGHAGQRSTISHAEAKPSEPPIADMLRRRFSTASLARVDKLAGWLAALVVGLASATVAMAASGAGDCTAICPAHMPCGFSYGVFDGGALFDCGYGMDCSIQAACRDRGRCTGGFGKRCVVGSDADCKQSRMCETRGDCTLVSTDHDGTCGPGSVGDCERSVDCSRYLKCSYSEAERQCVRFDVTE